MHYGLIPKDFISGLELQVGLLWKSIVALFSSMFMHQSWFHITFNMLFLWIFGDNVEDLLGHMGFLAFYLMCGIAAGIAHVVIHPHSAVPMIGASGAVAGVLGAYALSFPKARIQTYFSVWPYEMRSYKYFNPMPPRIPGLQGP
jgi:membrane associated rhomboid family serine protease